MILSQKPPVDSGGFSFFPSLMKFLTFCCRISPLFPALLYGFGAEDASRPVPLGSPGAADQSHLDKSRGVIAGKDDELVTQLLGLAVGTKPDAALHIQKQKQAGVELVGFSEQDAQTLRETARKFIGRPVTLRSLDRLSDAMESALGRSWEVFVKVDFPPQEITSGFIAVVVYPARAGGIFIGGKPAFGLKFSADAFRTRPGQDISRDVLMEDLDWINFNPLRRASLSYSDGLAPDALDLKLRIRADKPWRAYAGIDNQLSRDLGDERLFLGYQHGDLFSLDHRLTAQFTSSLDYNSLRGVSGTYEIPLPKRHLLDFSLGYTESESDTAGPIDQSGKFLRMALVYRIPLPRWQSISHEWRFGMEFRNHDYLFSDDTSDTVRFFHLETGWKGRRFDSLGMTRMDVSLMYSPGQGLLGSDDEDFIALGAGGAESWIARLELERTVKLGKFLTLSGRCQAQWADSDLLSSDQLTAGGVGRVRGFDETVGYVSKGVVASVELQSRSHHTEWAGDFQAITFLDGAALDREQNGDVGRLLSAGCGLRWRYEDRLAAKVDLGFPIMGPADENDGPMLYFALNTFW